MFTSEASQLFDSVALSYKDVCLCYIAEVGKLGARNNGLTLQWLAKSDSGRRLRRLLRELKEYALDKTREEKYFILRELYALKPGVHERFYYKEHEGRVFGWVQKEFGSNNRLDAKTTLFLKSILAIENFYDLNPFLDIEEKWCFPSTLEEAQAATKFLLISQNWKSLEMLKPLDSWLNWAPCAINEGPFVQREGRVLFRSLKHLEGFTFDYQKVLAIL